MRDDMQPSRHAIPPAWTETVEPVVLFNCCNARCAIVSGDYAAFGDAQDGVLKAVHQGQEALGRVLVSAAKGADFMSRLEFKNRWLVGADHGLRHDGIQADASIDATLDWRREDAAAPRPRPRVAVARVRVRPGRAAQDCAGSRARGRVLHGAARAPRGRPVRRARRPPRQGEHPRRPPRHRELHHAAGVRQGRPPDRAAQECMPRRDRARVAGRRRRGGRDGRPPPDPLRAARRDRPRRRRGGRGWRGWRGAMRRRMRRDAAAAAAAAVEVEVEEEVKDLNEFNHAVQRFSSVGAYEGHRAEYCRGIVVSEDTVEDAITGNHLRIEDSADLRRDAEHRRPAQTVGGRVAADQGRQGARRSPAPRVQSPRARHPPRAADPRPRGAWHGHDLDGEAGGVHAREAPAAVVAAAAPAMSALSALVVDAAIAPPRARDRRRPPHSPPRSASAPAAADELQGVRLVPMLVYVQRIVRLVREQGEEAHIIGELLRSRSMLPWYIRHTFEGATREMLLQAYEMRALIVLIDGIDEAAGMKEAIEEFVHKEVAVSGNRLVVTSRPEGIRWSSTRPSSS